jgi:TonB family protein
MNGITYQIHFDERESLRNTLVVSLALHGLLLLTAIGYTIVGPRMGGRWGNSWGGEGSAVRVGVVTSVPGMPLPVPTLTMPSTVATQNPGLYKMEEVKPPPPPPEAAEIPKFQESVAREKVERINPRIKKEEIEPPEHAIPYGHGGRPAMTYSQFVASGAGEGGLNLGEFGDRYGWYVGAVRNRVSSNWLLSMVSPNLMTAPRVYVTFSILRSGTIDDVKIVQSSGIPEVDRSALRAVLASNPFGPLPADYSGDKVAVEFYFDFHRR